MNKKIKLIISKLKENKIDLSLAESCTGGMLAQKITSVSGASQVFFFSIVAYSNQSKIKYLRVPEKVINKYGAVSEECCFSMVNGIAKISNAKLNLAITGIAGPNGGTKKKPVGLVYIAVKNGKKNIVSKNQFKNKGRSAIQKATVKKTLNLIMEQI